jgi:hypothetical protein
MTNLNNRPELPDIFPEEDVTVTGEPHTFQVSKTDSGTATQYKYTLDKAPVKEVNSVQGQDDSGNYRTFNRGTDYELASKTDRVTEDFVYNGPSGRQTYLLTYQIDGNTDVVTDESGTTYTEGTDYTITNSAGHYGDVIEWLESGDSPNTNEPFTVTYDVTFEKTVIEWQTDSDNLPEPGAEFFVTYRANSVIGRYLDAAEDELDDVEQSLTQVINNKFVDKANGDALDELGKLFGPTIGKRRGRNNTQYRIYLKSVVQSFISRGTVNGIKLAIAAATDVPIEDITINEDFTNVEYEVEVLANTPVTVELLEEVAEIADPSGVEQIRTRFRIDPDEAEVNDSIAITEGLQISDQMQANDTVANFGFGTEGAVFEDVLLDETVAVNPNKTTVSDQAAADDANSFTTEKITWDEASWDDFDWATEHN